MFAVMYIRNKQTAAGTILDRWHIYCCFLIKELKGREWLSLNKNSLTVSRLSNHFSHLLKAWNSATSAWGSGSLLLLVKTKQIISQDVVSYCFFFAHCLTITLSFDILCRGNKIHIVKSCTLRRVRKMTDEMIVPRNTVDKTNFHDDINIQNLRFSK